MVAEIIVRLDNLDIVNLGRLQNFAGASAPVMFELARTSPHFWKALVTRICAQIPMINGTPI